MINVIFVLWLEYHFWVLYSRLSWTQANALEMSRRSENVNFTGIFLWESSFKCRTTFQRLMHGLGKLKNIYSENPLSCTKSCETFKHTSDGSSSGISSGSTLHIWDFSGWSGTRQICSQALFFLVVLLRKKVFLFVLCPYSGYLNFPFFTHAS